MTLEEFIATLTKDHPPPDLSPPLIALWYQRHGQFDQAHEIVQAEQGSEAAWVHAFLHRLEGDLGNASYWYNRSGRNIGTESLDQEWRAIVLELLDVGQN